MGKISIAVAFAVLLVVWGTFRTVNGIRFEQEVGGYLKRAADANTVAFAAENLDVAVSYLKKNNITNGFTSVLWRTPDEDVGFWFNNLSSAFQELRSLPENVTPLERTNVLMKLRETLLDQGKGGMHVTAPEGISLYPSNIFYFLWGWVSLLGMVLGLIYVFVSED